MKFCPYQFIEKTVKKITTWHKQSICRFGSKFCSSKPKEKAIRPLPNVGAQVKGQSVCLKFDAFMLQWEVYAANGQFIKSLQAPYLAPSRIKNMTVYSKN